MDDVVNRFARELADAIAARGRGQSTGRSVPREGARCRFRDESHARSRRRICQSFAARSRRRWRKSPHRPVSCSRVVRSKLPPTIAASFARSASPRTRPPNPSNSSDLNRLALSGRPLPARRPFLLPEPRALVASPAARQSPVPSTIPWSDSRPLPQRRPPPPDRPGSSGESASGRRRARRPAESRSGCSARRCPLPSTLSRYLTSARRLLPCAAIRTRCPDRMDGAIVSCQ